jgi:hypothetical protein
MQPCGVKDRIVILVAIVAVLVGVVALYTVLTDPGISEPEIHITSVMTDKEVYQSKEVMEIRILVAASATLNNVSLGVEGIADASGKPRLDQVRMVNLKQGENEYQLNYTLPVCSRCAGLPAGNYSFNASLFTGNTTYSTKSYTVRIQ